ncbi:hypothetical protein [Streptomyces mesophilus]|uniref:hypothetical protein n=1 Tax=Streptomyces mesophilus TaxID=1775132 RepID=UPI003326C34B
MDGPLSDAEFVQLLGLLRRYCAHDLDQWEAWRTTTPYGEAHIMISNGSPPDAERDLFHDIDRAFRRLTWRPDEDQDSSRPDIHG